MSWSAGGALPGYFLLLHLPLSLALFFSLCCPPFHHKHCFNSLSLPLSFCLLLSLPSSIFISIFTLPVTGDAPDCWAEVRKRINRSVGDLAGLFSFAPAAVAEHGDSPPPSGLDRTGHFSSAQVQVTRQVRCHLGCQATAEKNPADESVCGEGSTLICFYVGSLNTIDNDNVSANSLTNRAAL